MEGRMVAATRHTSDMLDRKLKEPRELYFYLGGRYQVTANDANNKYSNSQLAMLFEMPTQEQLNKKKTCHNASSSPGIAVHSQ